MKKEIEKTIKVEMVVCDAHGCGAEVEGDSVEIQIEEFRGLSGSIIVSANLFPVDIGCAHVADVCEADLLAIVAYAGRNLGENGG